MPVATDIATPGRIRHEPVRPPLKWAGGKRWLLPRLQPIWAEHSHRRLVEPFAGGLAVTLGLRPEQALCNDVNPHLINFFRQVQAGLTVTLPMVNDSAVYYGHREAFNSLVLAGNAYSPVGAELFYYLNRTGFNGLCRFNRSGLFNVPFGRYAKIGYQEDFLNYVPVLSGWDFSVGDFASLAVDSSDFVYADPPYDVEFTSYSQGGFDWPDQVRLAEWLSALDGPVVLSNQATPRIVELYTSLGFELDFLDAPRMISCTGDRTKAREVLATRNL